MFIGKDTSLEKINFENYVEKEQPKKLHMDTSESILKENKKHMTSMSKNPNGLSLTPGSMNTDPISSSRSISEKKD